MKSKSFLCACLAAGAILCQSVLAGSFYPITVNYDPEYTEDEIKDETKKIKDFPALLRIPENSPIYAVAGENGENLHFTDNSGRLGCPHEIDTWNTNGVSLVWVKIPILQNGSVVRLYYEGTNSTQVTDVWSSYAGVWHLNEAVDSSGKDIEPSDGVTHTTKFYDCASIVTNGVIGKGLGSAKGIGAAFASKVYDDRNGYKRPIQVSNASKFTVSCWVHVQNVSAWSLLFGPLNVNSGNTGWKAEWTGANGTALRLCQLGGSGDRLVSFNNLGSVFTSGWGKIDAIWNNNFLVLYINGNFVGEKTNSPDVPTWYKTGWMGWGGCINSDGSLASIDAASGTDFDECRIFDGVASAKRIAADYATVADADFLLIGGLQSESDYPEGTVARVGDKIFQDLALAFSTAKADGVPVVLLADGLSWTFQNPGDSISIILGNFSFTANCGVGEGYYLDEQYDSATGATTYTVKKQIQVVAMRNVAVYKELYTRDLAALLPSQVAGLSEDGQIVGDFDVVWDVEDITKYDYAGITPVPGLATVGGKKLPVTAYVRATLSYADGYHNIAGEATNMVVTALATNNIDVIDDVTKISSSSPSLITNGLPATAQTNVWSSDSTGTFSNWTSGKDHPYVDVRFDWSEVKTIRRIEVIARTTSNVHLQSATIAVNGTVISGPDLPPSNVKGSEWINSQYNYRYDFQTPVETSSLNVTLEQGSYLNKDSVKISDHMDISEILIWAEGCPVDAPVASSSADLLKLEFDGNPLPGFDPGTTFYQYPGAHEVTAWAGDPNAGVTVLPELDGLIRVVTLAEDAETTKTYLILRRGYTMLLLR